MLTPNKLVLPFGGSYVCANFGENRSRNATVRVLADGQTHTHTHTDTQTDANRFHNLSHAICYSYVADNKSAVRESRYPDSGPFPLDVHPDISPAGYQYLYVTKLAN